MNISDEKIEDIALQFAIEYENKYKGCAQSTFMAINKTLKELQINILDSKSKEYFFRGLIGMSGGVGLTARGSCGALTGASMAVSLFKSRDSDDIDEIDRFEIQEKIREDIANKFLEKYGGLTCREVQWSIFNKAWNLSNKEMLKEYSESKKKVCNRLKEKGECTVALATKWGVQSIIKDTDLD